MTKLFRKMTVCILMISIMALGGCGQKEAEVLSEEAVAEAYASVLSELTEGQAYAYIETEEGKLPALLVTDATYESEEGVNAAIYCDVYYAWDKKPEKLVHLAADGTGYPICYDETGIYRAGLHSVSKYIIDFEINDIVLIEHVEEIFDEAGNVTYLPWKDGEENVDAVALLEKLREEYGAATIINFTKSK